MSFWAAIVIIVAVFTIGAVMRSRYNAMNGYATDQQGNPIGNPEREAELQRELDELRERVKVLERIAIDGREAKRLSAEIDNLRDE